MLDDFGSGLSSFAYLKNLPVDFLKIDGGFVATWSTTVQRALVESINQIGHVMGIQTIAEWVENPATVELLAGIGVDYAQGYWIEKPRPCGPRLGREIKRPRVFGFGQQDTGSQCATFVSRG